MELPPLESVAAERRGRVWNDFVADWTGRYGIDLATEHVNTGKSADTTEREEIWCAYARDAVEGEESRARRILYFGNKELAHFMARKHVHSQVSDRNPLGLDDFTQHALIALWESTEKWSRDIQSSFSVYASHQMRLQEFSEAQAKGKRTIFPPGVENRYDGMLREKREYVRMYREEHGKMPEPEDIQDELGIGDSMYEKLKFYEEEHIESTQAPRGEDRALIDIIGEDDQPLREEERRETVNGLRELVYELASGKNAARDAAITTHYLFGSPGRRGPVTTRFSDEPTKRTKGRWVPTLETVGDEYGLVRERVRQIVSELGDRLKEYLSHKENDLEFPH